MIKKATTINFNKIICLSFVAIDLFYAGYKFYVRDYSSSGTFGVLGLFATIAFIRYKDDGKSK